MKNINDPNEYHKFKSTTDGSNNKVSGGHGPGSICWIVIAIIILFLISFISDGASDEAILTLLGFGLIAYMFIKSIGG